MATISKTIDPSTLSSLKDSITLTESTGGDIGFYWNATTPYATLTSAEFTTNYMGSGYVIYTDYFTSTSVSGTHTISDAYEIRNIIAIFRFGSYSRTVQLDANGGSIKSSSSWTGSGATVTKSVNNGSQYGTLPTGQMDPNPTSDTITQTGYYFNGWWTTPIGGTQIVSTSGALLKEVGNIDQTLYANWAFWAKFDANGGTGAPDRQLGIKNGSLTIPLATPTRTNYRFAGWNTNQDGSGVSYSPGQSYSGTNITLYAQWASNTQVKVLKNGQWVSGQVKVYRNNSWQDVDIKRYDGHNWT